MRTILLTAALLTGAAACSSTGTTQHLDMPRQDAAAVDASLPAPPWSFNATIIEACSCPMFCQCYFNPQPASHPGCCPPGTDIADAPQYCRFNNVFRVNEGRHGDVDLDGAKFWVAGDLGGDFSDGEMTWAVVHFDPSVTEPQREGILTALGALYPVKWQSFRIAEDLPIEWKGGKDRSVAKLDGGKAGEVVLARNQGMTDEPIVIHNLRYWGAPRNDGFVLMANEVEAYRHGDEPFEHRGTNGFMITVDIGSEDVAGEKQGY